MGSRADIYRMIWALIGSLLGICVGIGLLMLLYQMVPALSGAIGITPLVTILVFCGGGLLGGGYLALWLCTRTQKARKKKHYEEKRKKKTKRKKKK